MPDLKQLRQMAQVVRDEQLPKHYPSDLIYDCMMAIEHPGDPHYWILRTSGTHIYEFEDAIAVMESFSDIQAVYWYDGQEYHLGWHA